MTEYIYVVAPLAGWLVAQSIKFVISLRQDGISPQDLFASGGMPSSHASFMAALVVVIYLEEGLSSSGFGVAFALLCIVVYDAIGVRRATGENTEYIIRLLKQSKIKAKRDSLHLAHGHTPLQVFAGVIVGFVVGLVTRLLFV